MFRRLPVFKPAYLVDQKEKRCFLFSLTRAGERDSPRPLFPPFRCTPKGGCRCTYRVHFMTEKVDSDRVTKPPKRDHVMRLRVTSDELSSYKAESEKRGFKSISDYFRWALCSENLSERDTPRLKKKKTLAPEREVNPELLYEIHRIGSNLNQIAKALNVANLADEEVSLKELFLLLSTIEKQLEKVIKQNEKASDALVSKLKNELLSLMPVPPKKEEA